MSEPQKGVSGSGEKSSYYETFRPIRDVPSPGKGKAEEEYPFIDPSSRQVVGSTTSQDANYAPTEKEDSPGVASRTSSQEATRGSDTEASPPQSTAKGKQPATHATEPNTTGQHASILNPKLKNPPEAVRSQGGGEPADAGGSATDSAVQGSSSPKKKEMVKCKVVLKKPKNDNHG